MNIGFSIGIDRGERFVSLDTYDQETITKSMVFPKKNWNRFVQLLPQIEDCLMNIESVEFKQQINGPCFLSITACYNYVDLSVYLFNPISGFGPDIVTNITVPLVDWLDFKTKIEQINEQFNDYA